MKSKLYVNGLLLDVRTVEEYEDGHIDGAVNIPHLKVTAEKILELSNNEKNKSIVIYCKSGRRAGFVKTLLESNGFTNVYNVGGMEDYLSLEKEEK